MPRAFLTLICLKAAHYLEEKVIEIWFPGSQTIQGLPWWADGDGVWRGSVSWVIPAPTDSPWGKQMTYFCRISPKLITTARGLNTVTLFFSHCCRAVALSSISPRRSKHPSLHKKTHSLEWIESRACPDAQERGVQRVHPPKPPCRQVLWAQAAAHNVLLCPAPGEQRLLL